MLKPSTPFLVAFMMLFLFIACKKGDHNGPVPGKDTCMAEIVEVNYYNRDPGAPPLYADRGYQFKKTFKPDGSISQLYINTPGPYYREHVNGLVVKTGNSLFLLDSLTKDTAFRATFDANGRVVSSYLAKAYTYEDSPPYTYTYNDKGQLASITYYTNVSTMLYYDNYGDVNLTSRKVGDSDENTFYSIVYDYSVPVKGAVYDLRIFSLQPQILEALGYFDLSPRYKVKYTASDGEGPNSVKTFFDQQINAAGYLTDYKSSVQWDIEDYPIDTFITHISWHCTKVKKNKLKSN